MARALKSGCTSRKAHQTTKSRLLNSYKECARAVRQGVKRLRVRSVTDFIFVDTFMSADNFMSEGAAAPTSCAFESASAPPLQGRLSYS